MKLSDFVSDYVAPAVFFLLGVALGLLILFY